MLKTVIITILISFLVREALGQGVCGTPVGTAYKGVYAYSNGVDTGQESPVQSCQASPIKITTDPAGPQTYAGQDGEQYQCVELIRRFYREAICLAPDVCSVPPSPTATNKGGWFSIPGPGGSYYGNAQDFFPHAGLFGLVAHANLGTVPPQPDDIIAFAPAGPNPPIGHVAIATAVDLSGCVQPNSGQFTVQLLEQNTNRPHKLTGVCQQTQNGFTYTLNPRCPTVATCPANELGLPIQGWLRLPPSPGIQPWTHTWGGTASDSIASVAADSIGNLYAVGSTSSFGAGGSDVLLLKYDSSGNLLWSRTWGGTGSENGNGVAVDSLGNVYIAGGTNSFGAGWYDALILKFDSSGNLLWSRTWGGTSFDVGYDLAFDASGNLYVAAESYSLGNRAALLKLDANGNYLGVHTWKGPATYDSGYSVDVDKSGNVVLAGISWNYSVSPNHNSILVVKFDSNGTFLWHRDIVSGAEDEASGAKVVRFDGSGNILIAGHRAAVCNSGNFSTCNFDADIIKLDANGDQIWASSWGGTGFESLGGLAFDSSGNLIASGGTNGFLNGMSAALLLKADPTGNWLSSQIWGGNGASGGSGVAVGGDGGIVVGGYAPNASGGWSSVVGSPSNVLLTLGTTTGNVGTATFILGTPTGVVGKPVGVSDTGGGGQDTLVIKTSIP